MKAVHLQGLIRAITVSFYELKALPRENFDGSLANRSDSQADQYL